MASTIQVIANLLQVNEQEAERFFREVQVHFEGEVPEDGLIIQVIREHRTDRLTPEEVALIAKKKAHAKAERAAGGDPRAARETLNKCPHGVSLGQRCHSCERDRRSERRG